MFRAPNAETLKDVFRFCPTTCSLTAGFPPCWSAEILQRGQRGHINDSSRPFEAINPKPTLPYTKCSFKAEQALRGRMKEDKPTDEENRKRLNRK